ncbi:MAG: hypothetical protein HN472_10115 [Nitrospina sp.]|nr:hypothetical protein [Nitrospina sp.]MBT3509879.1 hypothetical protein [Nitrospina sp.]MBT3874488.1 hypothetical protein [Nitrospina sp.]MBT4049121.1 hypothetical protein [Nitrospina sp.]MBT4559159.1 hypothetical protein [Nitrospina sp.]
MIPTIDGVPIGATTPSTGEFTNLTLGTETITNFSDIDDDKVKASSGDTAPGFLDSKIVAGTGITVTPGTNQVTISSTGGGGGSVEDSADGVEITFAEELEISPGVSGIFIRGTGLFADPATIISTVKAGKETYTIDAQAVLTGEQQVIVTPPTGIGRTAGHHRVKLVNAQGFSEGFISLSEIIAPPPAQGDAFTKLLLHGDGTGNSFLDSSASNHPLTIGGNVTQSVAQSGGVDVFPSGSSAFATVWSISGWRVTFSGGKEFFHHRFCTF